MRSEKNARWKGKPVERITRPAGVAPLEACCCWRSRRSSSSPSRRPSPVRDDDAWRLRGEAWQDDRCVIGGSDAGAHLDMINTFALSTQLLGEGVRVRKLLSLEDAVRRITSLPADRFGLKDRGRLAVGAVADIVVFDPDTMDCGPISLRNDLPEGEPRLYAESVGITTSSSTACRWRATTSRPVASAARCCARARTR